MPQTPVSFADFKRFTSPGLYCPLVKRLDFFEDAFKIYRCWRNEKNPSVLLESARITSKTGRYSLIAKDPFMVLEAKDSEVVLSSFGEREVLRGDPFQITRRILKQFTSKTLEGLAPFTGGAIGYFSYEAKNYLEPNLSKSAKEGMELPEVYLLFFDEGLILDHEEKALYIFTNIKIGRDPRRSYSYGLRRLDTLERNLKRSWKNRQAGLPTIKNKRFKFETRAADDEKSGQKLLSSLNREEFIEKVKRIKCYIRKGDIFQANLSQRFSFELEKEPLDIYENLKEINPSPFFGYLDAVHFQIISGSPERLLKLEKGILETRPIAGTRARGKNDKEDKALSMDLLLSPKERAEHIMLLDLERNDMGRVAEYGSVTVNEFMELENYSHVKHIVSNVQGILSNGLEAIDALRAFFPGGTITGAPKVRCMEILDELEPVERGPYTGSLGYLSFTGNMDFNILIRSLVVKNGHAYLQVGAGIVADSIPEKEYEETLYKAEGVLSAVFGKRKTGGQAGRQRSVAARLS